MEKFITKAMLDQFYKDLSEAVKTVACSMCGPFCPMNLIEKFVEDAKRAREEVKIILEKSLKEV